MKKNKIYYLVGLPCKEKDDYIKENSDKNVLVSFNNIRKELYGYEKKKIDREKIIEEMTKKTKLYLEDGMDVLYEYGDINSKKRQKFLSNFNDAEKICIYFACDIDDSLAFNNNSEKKFSRDSMNKTFKNLQIPMYHEGWDEIKIIRDIKERENKEIKTNNLTYDDYINELKKNESFSKAIGFNQDNPYHSHDVGTHMYYVYKYVSETTEDEDLIIAAMFHDTGKPYCKEFNGKYARYIGHENVSAQLVINYLMDLNFEKDRILDIATLVQLHMRMLNLRGSEKGKEKLIKNIGMDRFRKLELLYSADTKAK